MVTPVNSDKPMTLGTNGTTPSTGRASSTEATGDKNQNSIAPQADTGPDVENARQLYQLENNPLETVRPSITSPEAARTLLNQILEQFSAAPADAIKVQGSGSNGLLGNLLSTAPA